MHREREREKVRERERKMADGVEARV